MRKQVRKQVSEKKTRRRERGEPQQGPQEMLAREGEPEGERAIGRIQTNNTKNLFLFLVTGRRRKSGERGRVERVEGNREREREERG